MMQVFQKIGSEYPSLAKMSLMHSFVVLYKLLLAMGNWRLKNCAAEPQTLGLGPSSLHHSICSGLSFSTTYICTRTWMRRSFMDFCLWSCYLRPGKESWLAKRRCCICNRWVTSFDIWTLARGEITSWNGGSSTRHAPPSSCYTVYRVRNVVALSSDHFQGCSGLCQ